MKISDKVDILLIDSAEIENWNYELSEKEIIPPPYGESTAHLGLLKLLETFRNGNSDLLGFRERELQSQTTTRYRSSILERTNKP